MIAFAAFHASTRATLRSPWAWLWLGVAAMLWASFSVFGPIGITTTSPDLGSTAYELAFLGLLGGNLLGLRQSQRLAWLVDAHPGAPRLALLLGIQLASSVIFLVFALVPGVWVAHIDLGPWNMLLILRALAVMSLLATVLRLLPWSESTAALALIGATWLLPAALAGRGPTGEAIASVLDVLPRQAQALRGDLEGTEWKHLVQPIIGWLALACLLADGRRGAKHALRNPG